MDKQILFEKIKTARLQRYITNCYSMDAVEHYKNLWSNEDGFIFSYDDHGVQRLMFFVKTWEAINPLLSEIESGRYFLEFMTNNPDEYSPRGAERIASMMRLANLDCRNVFESDSSVIQYKDAAIVESAKEHDFKEINEILWSTFQTEISHLISDEEMKTKIREGKLTIHKAADGHIDALLQAEVMPKKFYINQIVNNGERKVIHAILLNRLEEYIKNGGKYLYAWVEEKNIPSMKFHEKYGMRHDGMRSLIYCIER